MLLHNFFQVTLIWGRTLVVLVRFSEMYVVLYLIVGDIILLLIAYNLGVILTDKHNHTDLTHWFFFSALLHVSAVYISHHQVSNSSQ